jgi:hypothetical protein
VSQTNLQNESAEYLTRREEPRLAEIELMRQREQVAGLRRALPPGAIFEDYIFEKAPAEPGRGRHAGPYHLSELFTGPNRPLMERRIDLLWREPQQHRLRGHIANSPEQNVPTPESQHRFVSGILHQPAQDLRRHGTQHRSSAPNLAAPPSPEATPSIGTCTCCFVE